MITSPVVVTPHVALLPLPASQAVLAAGAKALVVTAMIIVMLIACWIELIRREGR